MNFKYYQKLSLDLAELYEDDAFCDVIIEAGHAPNNKIFCAHSLILNYRSSYFRRKLSQESANGRIKFKFNVSCEVIQVMLKYIYTGVLSLKDQSPCELLNLLIITEKFHLTELTDHLQQYILEHHTPWLRQHFELVHRTSYQHQTFHDLQKFCSYIIKNTPEIIFHSQDFTSIQENFLISLLQREHLGIKEVQVWHHLIRWGMAQNPSLTPDPASWSLDDFKTLESNLKRCIPLIRFFELTSQEFYDKVRPYRRILPSQLYEDLIKYYMKSNSQSPLNILPPRRIAASIYNIKNHSRPNSRPGSRPGSRPCSRPNSRSNSRSNSRPSSPLLQSPAYFRIDGIDSELITCENASLIANWIGRKDYFDFTDSPFEFKLLFRGSIDGLSPTNFHKICDNKLSTLVIIKVYGTGEIIGGYNPIRWKSLKGSWGNTEDSFIFSLRGQNHNLTSPILSRLVKGQSTYALNYEPNLGPSFGISDLKIEGSNFRNESKCYCLKGCYEKSIRTTSGFFSIEDYEVFQVRKK